MALVETSLIEYFVPLGQEITIEAKVYLVRERYGEDADGNRGVDSWITERSIVVFQDQYGEDITKMMQSDFDKETNEYVELLEERALEAL